MWRAAHLDIGGHAVAGAYVNSSGDGDVCLQSPDAIDTGEKISIDGKPFTVLSCEDVSGRGDKFMCEIKSSQSTPQKTFKRKQETDDGEETAG